MRVEMEGGLPARNILIGSALIEHRPSRRNEMNTTVIDRRYNRFFASFLGKGNLRGVCAGLVTLPIAFVLGEARNYNFLEMMIMRGLETA